MPPATPVPLVCVPGLGLGAAAWRPTLDALARTSPGRRGEVVLLPGYGVRPDPGEDVSTATLAGRLLTALARLPGPVALAGHSASCLVVARAAALAPERVSALVLLGPAPDPRTRSWPGLATRWLRTAVWERPREVPMLARSYTATGLGHIARTMNTARADDLTTPLAAAGRPVLVVRGRHDRLCPQDWAEVVADHGAPGSHVATLPRGAHLALFTHPGDTATAVGSFLRTR